MLAHGFRSSGPCSAGSLALGPVVRPTHHAGAYVGKQSCSPHGSQKTREHGSSSPCVHERTPFLPQGSTPNDPPLHRLAAKPVNTDPLETPVHSKVRVSPSLPVDMTHAWPSSTSAHSLCFKAVSLYFPLLNSTNFPRPNLQVTSVTNLSPFNSVHLS